MHNANQINQHWRKSQVFSRCKVWDQIEKQAWFQTTNQMELDIYDRISNKIESQVNLQIWYQIQNQVHNYLVF